MTSKAAVELKPPEPLSEEVSAALARSVALSDKLFAKHPGKCDSGGRQDQATRLFGLALDHREAIILLLVSGARSSAYALVRSVYEACFRGLWVNYAAEQHQLDALKQGVSPKFETIVKQLHRAPAATPSGVFAQSKALAWDALCDYSHGGGRQLARWQNDEEIGPSHPDHEIPGLLLLLDYFASASSLGMHDASDGLGTLKSEILDELQKALALIERSTSVRNRQQRAAE